jgi:hypothetical protein
VDGNGEDAYENLASRYEWQDIVRRVRFGPRSKTREIALVLSHYGNRDGTSCYPGIARLAAVAECSERTVRDALERLRELGLLQRVEEGSRRGRPKKDGKPRKDHHILTIPPDIEDRVAMLPPDELDPEREQRRIEERRADNKRRRAKRQETKAATPEYQGKVEEYQGKAEPVSGESYGDIRGKLRPDIRATTSEDAAYPSIRPIHRPLQGNNHPAPRERAHADARAPKSLSRLELDEDDPDSKREAITHALGDDLDVAEDSKVRGMLRKDVHPDVIYNHIRKMRGDDAA